MTDVANYGGKNGNCGNSPQLREKQKILAVNGPALIKRSGKISEQPYTLKNMCTFCDSYSIHARRFWKRVSMTVIH